LGKKSIQGGATERDPPIRVGTLRGSLTQRPGPVANSENYKETELERRDTFSKKSHNEYIRVIDNTVIEKDNQKLTGGVTSPTEEVMSPRGEVTIPGLEAMSSRLDVMSSRADVYGPIPNVMSPMPDVMSPRKKRTSLGRGTGSLFGSRRL
jgi:hypothetical protein